MWFLFSVLTLLFWSGSDIFSKVGCTDKRDKYSPLKMVTAVGVVMGLHALFMIFVRGVVVDSKTILTYLPVSFLYIGSMALGYLGLRYIELSVSSPICNSSGAVVAILTFLTVGIGEDLPPVALVAVACVCVGVIGLGFVESREDDALRAARQEKGNYKYSKSWIALLLPVVYCILDALGTFADSRVLEVLDEDAANCAYELTFLVVGVLAFIYTKFIKKQNFLPKEEGPKYIGAVCETIGQFFYIYALADAKHVAFSAPIMSSYCMLSAVWGHLFLKERLSKKHYVCIAVVFVGIVILGILDI
ncbi:MAG: DMT family transporter [Clostridia bacterium]|nr:DMT family transporter [Clostridia bacterium]